MLKTCPAQTDKNRPRALVTLMMVAALLLQLLSPVQASLPEKPRTATDHCMHSMQVLQVTSDNDCHQAQAEQPCCDSTHMDCADHCAQGGALVLGSLMALPVPAAAHRYTYLMHPPDAPVYARYQPPRPVL